MGFRTVVIKSRAKLETRLNSMIIRGETEQKVFIKEINTLIIQSTAVSLTAALLCELIKNNVKVIFCDEKCNPCSELLPYYGNSISSKRYKEQFAWSLLTKELVWQKIIALKISEQASFLREKCFFTQAEMLCYYINELLPGDITNREGHAAKVYFNCLFGPNNSRNTESYINTYLNYGYTILLSAFNREIVSSGYLTQLGIWHNNEFNDFNLACDLMEPFRVTVDRVAFSISENDSDFKRKLINILNFHTIIDGKETTLDLAIKQYTKSVINALNSNSEDEIIFPEKIFVQNEF